VARRPENLRARRRPRDTRRMVHSGMPEGGTPVPGHAPAQRGHHRGSPLSATTSKTPTINLPRHRGRRWALEQEEPGPPAAWMTDWSRSPQAIRDLGRARCDRVYQCSSLGSASVVGVAAPRTAPSQRADGYRRNST
jgi:hypothetical protein